MTRPIKVEDRRPKTLSLDSSYYKEFESIVGAGNVSEEIRAFIKERVDESKGVKNVAKHDTSKPNYIFQDFETKDKRDELRKYIGLEPDMHKLNTLYRNCKTVVGMVDTRKEQNHAKAEFDRRASQKSNEEIETDIKAERRRRRV
jgi:hypothetical protein